LGCPFLKKTIESINANTLYPHYIFVVDSHSTDGTDGYLRSAKVNGKIFDSLILPENMGSSRALNELFTYMESWEKKRPMNDFVVTSDDDVIPPNLRPCWLEQMIDIFQRNEPEGLGALAMRIQRMARADIDESKDIIYWNKGIPSVFRLMRRSDLRQLGDRPFGRLLKWASNSMADKCKLFLKKRYGFATHIYGDHIGFMAERKGYNNDVEALTVADNKLNERNDKPYPDVDSETNVPIKINHPCDAKEMELREEHQKWLSDMDIGSGLDATIIILTCHRPDGLKRLLESINKTRDVKYEILVIADRDDKFAYNYCLEKNIKCILSNYHRDFVAQANLGVYICETQYFVLLSDDCEVVDNFWLRDALSVFKEKFSDGIGLLAFNDGIQDGKLFTMGMTSKRFVKEIGNFLYYPAYGHYGADREVSNLAKEMKCYYYDSNIKVSHHHYAKEGKEKDKTYRLSEELFWKRDQNIKRHRQQNVNLLEAKNHYDWS